MDTNGKNGFGLDLFFNTSSVEQLEAVFDAVPSSIVIVNADGQFLYVNKRGLELYGIEYSGLDLTAHISKVNALNLNGEPFPLEDMPVSHSLKSGQTVRNIEMIIENANGIKYPVNVSSAPLYNNHGEIKGAVVIFEDFTKRKQAEDVLIESNDRLVRSAEEKYRLLFNMIDQGFFIIDIIFDENDRPVDMYYEEANNAATKMLGMDFTGKRLRDIDPNYEEYWFKIFGDVALTGQSIRMEQYADPDKKWYSFFIFRIGDEKSCRIGNIFLDITSKKQAEEALKESEKLYRTLFTNSLDGFVLVEPIFDESRHSDNYIMVNVNQAWEKQTGLKAVDFIGKTIRESLPGVESLWPEIFGNVAKSGESLHFESFNHNSNRWYDIFAFNYQKGRVGVLFRDISERKKIEEALRQSEKRLRALTIASTNVVYRMNPDWSSMVEMYGHGFLTDTEEADVSWLDKYILPEDQWLVTGMINECIKNKKLFELEHRLVKQDGSIGWTSSKAIPLMDDNGEIKEWFGTASDITERKQAEEMKRENEERQEFLLKLSDTLKPLANPAEIQNISARLLGEHLAVNQVHYGETVGDFVIIHQGYGSGLPPMTGSFRYMDFGERLIATYRAGKTAVCYNVNTDITITKDEAMVITGSGFRAYISVPLVKHGRWVATLAVHSIEPRVWTPEEVMLVEEIAERTWAAVERAKVEEALREHQEQIFKIQKEKSMALEESIKLKDEFLYLITHEFKTPITVISSAIQSIDSNLKSEVPKRLGRYLNMIKMNTNRQLRLVNNLLDITRMNSGNIKFNMGYFDIVYVTKAIVTSVELYALQKSIKLHFTSKIAKKEVFLDDEKYERIMLNLLSNALKFTPNGKSIYVILSTAKIRNQNFIRISVKDEGIGIPGEKQQIIFDRFGQADTSMSRQAEGTGLGLHLVKLLVDSLGGEISLISKIGYGSTFTFLLPVKLSPDFFESTDCYDHKPDIYDMDSRITQAVNIEFSDIYFM